MSKVAIIADIASATSRINGVIDQINGALQEKGVEATVLNVRALPPEDLVYLKFDSPAIASANAAVEGADAVIVVTPVYKAAYTGILKAYLDLLPQKALVGKTILPVALGGTMAHMLILDYALKPVLAALGATNQLQGVFVLDSQVAREADGSMQVADEAAERLNAVVRQL